MGQPVVHFEIGARDYKKAMEFYAKVFDGVTTSTRECSTAWLPPREKIQLEGE